MKKLIITIIFGLGFLCINAQTAEVTSIQKLAGPRVGVTFLMPGSSADFVNEGFDSDLKSDQINELIFDQTITLLSLIIYQIKTENKIIHIFYY